MKKNNINENLPLFEIVCDDEETGLRYLSIVKKPAILVKSLAFASKRYDLQPKNYESHWYTHENCNCSFNEGNWTFEPSDDGKYPCDNCIKMSDKYKTWYKKRGTGSSSKPGSRNFNDVEFCFQVMADKQILVGPAMIPDIKIYREDDDGNGYYVKFSVETIKKLVDKFIKNDNNRSINLEHSDTMVPAYIQEHWIVENSTYDKSKYYGFNLPVGTWFVIVKVEDTDFWNEDIKEEKRYGFSIEGILGTKLIQMAEEIDLKFQEYIEEIINSMSEEDFMEIVGVKELKFESYSDYPDGVKNNAKKVLDWTEKNGWGSCGTPVGKQRANQLAKGEAISLNTIKRMYSYLSRHEVDLESSKSFGDGCGYLMYMAWGGKAALGWSRNKLRELGELNENSKVEQEFVEPKKGENENEFISRCISYVMNKGETDDNKQAAAICYNIWDKK